MENRAAESARFYVLHDVTATWLTEKVPLHVPHAEQVNGKARMYNDVPAVKAELVDHSMQFPGGLVEGLEPRAARDLHVSGRDTVEVTFAPMQYSVADDEPPQLLAPATLYNIRDGAGTKGDINFQFSPMSPGSFFISWNGRGESVQVPSRAECNALTLIARRLEDFHQAMLRDGSYPQDVFQYRSEREITEAASRITAMLEREARQAAREQLQQAPVHDDVDPRVLYQLQYEHASHDKTYAHVSHDEINALYGAMVARIMECNRSLYIFSAETAGRLSPIIHSPEVAAQTIVSHLTLKAERSKRGPVVSFIIGKTVLLREGPQREETDTFFFHHDRYIRVLQFEEASRGRIATARADMRCPMLPAHAKAFRELLSWLEPETK